MDQNIYLLHCYVFLIKVFARETIIDMPDNPLVQGLCNGNEAHLKLVWGGAYSLFFKFQIQVCEIFRSFDFDNWVTSLGIISESHNITIRFIVCDLIVCLHAKMLYSLLVLFTLYNQLSYSSSPLSCGL